MKYLFFLILTALTITANCQNSKRDTSMVIATYQLGNTLSVQSSLVMRIHVDTVQEVIDSAKSTLKNVVKTTKKADFIYYLVPYADTLKEGGKVKLDTAGKVQYSTHWAQYPAQKVSEHLTANGYLWYNRSEAIDNKQKPKPKK